MTKHVLIVEDSRAMRGLIRATVEQLPGFTTHEAGSGFDALKALPTQQFDLIITDSEVPEKTVTKLRDKGIRVTIAE